MLRVGALAEEMLTKKIGRRGQRVWRDYAFIYQRRGFSEADVGTWPTDSGDSGHNQPVHERVRDKQNEAVRTFLAANKKLLLELAHELKEKGELDARALRPFLARVEWTDQIQPLKREK